MNILDTIIVQKRKQVEADKTKACIKELEQSLYFLRKCYSIKAALLQPDKQGIIGEIKRKSPSRGVINKQVSISKISTGYVRAGVSALSILTDTEFFGGSNQDLTEARKLNECPILRKDFIIDEYQIFEAKSIGADAILLIAAVLPPPIVKRYAQLAHSLGLEVLLEVHNDEELQNNLAANADLIGVNNRNLKTFEVSIEVSKKLINQIPKGTVAVSESGIETPAAILELKQAGYKGFLIGQTFMQEPYPELAARDFIEGLKIIEPKAHA